MDYPEYKKRKTEEDLRREIMELRKKVNELEENVSRSRRESDAGKSAEPNGGQETESGDFNGSRETGAVEPNGGRETGVGDFNADISQTEVNDGSKDGQIGKTDDSHPTEKPENDTFNPAEKPENGFHEPAEKHGNGVYDSSERPANGVHNTSRVTEDQSQQTEPVDVPESDNLDTDEEQHASFDDFGDRGQRSKYDSDDEEDFDDEEEEYNEGKPGGRLSAGDLAFRILTGLLIFAICITAVTAVLLATGRLNGVIDNFGNEEEEAGMAESLPDVTPTVRVTLTPTPTPVTEVTETPVPEATATKAPKPTAAPDTSKASGTESKTADAAVMTFKDVDDVVTAKETTNLRNVPSQGEESFIVYILQNGETLKRTGISDEGWSRLEYEGQVVYAMSNLLTTDLTKKDDSKGTGAGDAEVKIQTVFTDVNEQVTPKIEVNLRKLPSVTNPNATVVANVKNGEVFTRTGVNEELGWSRVEYNGQTLYCISSYVETVTPAA
ncbi:MAG TPA: hypothetical protein DCG37_05280 [Lachnospiraceae bacterium]|nr:hypothetical protein [Lachnospiraceae bacterium]